MAEQRLGQFYEGFASWRRALARAAPESQPVIFFNAVAEVAGFVRAGLDRVVAADELSDMAASIGFDDADRVQQIIGTTFASIDAVYERPAQVDYSAYDDDDWSDPVRLDRLDDVPREQTKPKANGHDPQPAQPAPLVWLDMSRWDDEPRPELEWAIVDRVPLRQPGLFSGEGGAGKSIIELMHNVAHVAGKDWMGSLPEPGPAFYIGAEDDEKVLHARLYDIAKHYGVTFRELIAGGLRVLCMLGKDATLVAATGKSGKVEVTALYRSLYEQAGDLKPKNISIDTLTRAFAGNELDRVQVYGYAMHMQALANVANGSVTTLSHPSLQGISSGSGISGSTAWHGAFRYRLFLQGVKTDDEEEAKGELRQLEFKKNQYGPKGETVTLRYERGLFLPVPTAGSFEQIAAEAAADNAFLDLLARFTREGRTVGIAATSNNYAATLFAKEKCGLSYKQLDAAMRRLFAAGKIKVETYGKPSNPHQKLVRTEGATND